ncbi:MAG: nucleoside triphosphate pyrophosphohydrolase [Lentimicrobiaceae bacterium]|jgi:XTP/dITP diphosphohydrolase|nr:nucleoside triphosphate pyrophosphohydrolase [Lentimicrobiaceae bacterium]
MNEKLEAFGKLLDIMQTLRKECPWDKKQTIESLRYLTIEETYELSEAILDKNMSEIKKELGDLMLHLVFYAQIASEQQAFNIKDVLDSISEKLITRHPHIFSDVKAATAKDVAKNWEKIKLKEGKKSVLEGVPNGLPALVKSYRMQEKAAGVGFEWDNRTDVLKKIIEECDELNVEIENNTSHDKIEDEFGDLMFALVNYSRYLGINPEDALERSNKKFKRRFTYIEEKAAETNRRLHDMTLSEMDHYWNEAKKHE